MTLEPSRTVRTVGGLTRSTCFRSLLIALGLCCGHWVWTMFAVVYDRGVIERAAAYTLSDEPVEAVRFVMPMLVWDHAKWLWASATPLSWQMSVSPWIWRSMVGRVVSAWLVVWVVWWVARLLVRLLAARGVSGFGGHDDLTAEERVVPPWSVVVVSPVYALCVAVSMAMIEGLMLRSPVGGGFGSDTSVFPRAEADGHSILFFAMLYAAGWGVLTVLMKRHKRTSDHRAWLRCSGCGCVFGGVETLRCLECGEYPPRASLRPRRWSWLVFVLLTPVFGALGGVVATGQPRALFEAVMDPRASSLPWLRPVIVPTGRVVVASGEWGDLYFAAVLTGTKGLVLRAVLLDEGGVASGAPVRRVQTVYLDGVTIRNVVLPIPEAPSVYNTGALSASWSGHGFLYYGQTPVFVSGFVSQPDRVVSLPASAGGVPDEILEILEPGGVGGDWVGELLDPLGPPSP